MKLRESLAPGSLKVSESLVAMGVVAYRGGHSDEVEKYAGKAVSIQHRLAPGSSLEAFGLELLAVAAWNRGDLPLAEKRFNQVLKIRNHFSPDSILCARTLNNLGAVAMQRGDLSLAENYDRRAIAIEKKEAPGGLEFANTLHNLGTVLWVSFDLEGSQRILDEGTLALSYSVGPQKTHLFMIGPGANEFKVVTLDIGEKMLRHKIRRLRNALTNPNSDAETIRQITRDLSQWTLQPAADEIARARRILIIPDGPFHLLPFSVLPGPNGDEYLIQSKPIHRASSFTVFKELKADRKKGKGFYVVGFGDPVYSRKQPGQSANLFTAYTRGQALSQLPWSRTEVSGLNDVFPGSSRIWTGEEATEERVRSVGKETNILHFACHGLIDEGHPLESALILSMPVAPEDQAHNGILQAWEVFESLRLDADLVVLSACQTALGRELAGEGILGLTRAFQFAGARSVVASLWSVADQSTAEFMRHFYQYLSKGLTKDEALRTAQLDFISGPLKLENGVTLEASHPYYWAAFQLIGDWQ